MAKYIVFSDSHGKNDRMYDIIRKNQDQIDGLFHLGDVGDAAEELSLMVKGPVYLVRGIATHIPACARKMCSVCMAIRSQ